MGLLPMPPPALISSIARVAPLRMNSPYPPSGPERMHWHPMRIGFFSLRSGGAAREGSALAPARAREDCSKRRREIERGGAMESSVSGRVMILPSCADVKAWYVSAVALEAG